MRIVCEVSRPIDLLLAVRETGAQLVFLSLPRSADNMGVLSHLLMQYPDLLVIALSALSSSARMYHFRLEEEDLDLTSPDELLTRVRSALAESRGLP